ncbi:MAG: transcription antitermination factor NusB [Candidatus Sericytochromatia bacterium]|nr:transcription antitermination factor NusB [Candidatus Sericytochromatia bacterium]
MGKGRTGRMPATPRGLAVQKRLAVTESGAWPDRLLEDLPAAWPERDRAFLTALVQETTRLERFLDDLLAPCLKQPLDRLDPPVREILRTATVQLAAMDPVPDHAVVSEAVKLARQVTHEGAARLVNAVLRRVAGAEDRSWSRRLDAMAGADPEALGPAAVARALSLPDDLLALWWDERGPADALGLALAAQRATPFAFRAHVPRETLLAQFLQSGLKAEAGPLVPEEIRVSTPGRLQDLPGYAQGHWAVQGPAAMLATHVLDPRPGERIADLGAAPGGKTGHILSRLGGRGTVVAVDRHGSRLDRLRANAQRWQLGMPEVIEADAADPGALQAAGLVPGSFDKVLLDAPCSGLGTLYRKADLRWRWSRARTRELAELQQCMLRAAFGLLRPGGTLVYATCTLARDENEGVVASLLASEPHARAGDLHPWLPSAWSGEAARGMMTMMPHRHGTEGFFLARIERMPS